MVKPLENLISALTAKPANVDFLVLLIGLFNGQDEIFSKAYVWKRPGTASVQATYDNSTGTFSGLPTLSAAVVRRTNRLKVPKEKSLELKLVRV